MRRSWTRMLSLVLVFALVVSALPTVCAAEEFSDSSSEGAAITIGIFITMLVVLFVIGLREDVSNVFGQETTPVDTEAVAAELASVLGEAQVDGTPDGDAASGLAQVRSSGLGFRVEF
jgi:hypothetical protein